MKKVIGMILSVLLILAMVVSASAEGIVAQGIGYENVPFSDGSYGFCIDRDGHDGAYSGDSFTVASDTSAAISNHTNEDISQKLKTLFVYCFEEIFEPDGNGSYCLKEPNTVLGVVYHFSEGQYVWGEQKNLVDKVNSYTGAPIADSGESITLANGDVVTFDFQVLVPQRTKQQYFFAYRISVTNQTSDTHEINVVDNGNGSASASVTSGESGTVVTLNAVPSAGYRFKEWEVVSGNVTIENNSFVVGDEDVEIRAIFEKIPEYTVTFNANGGEGDMDPQSVTEGESEELDPNEFTREGYEFIGWNTKPDGSGTDVTDEALVTLNSNTVLYAQWKEIPKPEYTVTFNANGGEGDMDPQSVTEGESEELDPNEFTREGYEFIGWNTKPDGSGTDVADEALVTLNSNTVLYAQWEKIIPPTEIVKNPEDEYVVEGQNAEFGVEGSGEGLTYQWYTFDEESGKWIPLNGETNPNLVIPEAELDDDGSEYLCAVCGDDGEMVWSDSATLHVSPAPELPDTGDASTPLLWAVMAMLSVLGMMLLRKRACAE